MNTSKHITLPLNIRTNNGEVVDSADITLSVDAIAQIVDAAADVGLACKDATSIPDQIGALIDVLVQHGVIDR